MHWHVVAVQPAGKVSSLHFFVHLHTGVLAALYVYVVVQELPLHVVVFSSHEPPGPTLDTVHVAWAGPNRVAILPAIKIFFMFCTLRVAETKRSF